MLTRFKGSKAFLQEVNAWLDEKIIDEHQARVLIARYELDKEAPWYLRSSFMLRGLAITLVLAGFILIISMNWNNLPFLARMMTGILPLLVSFFLVFYYLNREDHEAMELSLFAASILFGINIFLQAQIFNISAYFPDGFLWWLIGALPIAIYMRSHLLGIVLQLIMIVWLNLEMQNIHFNWFAPLLMAGFLYLMYRKANQVAVIIHMVVLYYFYSYISLLIEHAFQPEMFLRGQHYLYFWHIPNLVCIGWFYMSLFLTSHEGYSEKFKNRLFGGISFILAFCFYIYTFEGTISLAFFYSPLFLFGLTVVLLIIQKHTIPIEVYLSGAVVLVVFIAKVSTFFFLEEGFQGFWYAQEVGVYPVFIFMNIAFLTFAVAKIYVGIQQHLKGQFMTGIFYIIALALARYISLFGDYLTTAIIFIVCGVGIYFLNNLWNQRYAAQ